MPTEDLFRALGSWILKPNHILQTNVHTENAHAAQTLTRGYFFR